MEKCICTSLQCTKQFCIDLLKKKKKIKKASKELIAQSDSSSLVSLIIFKIM